MNWVGSPLRRRERGEMFYFVIQSCLHAEVQRFGTQA
jgi:hypothetical protein